MPEDYSRTDYLTPAEVGQLWGITANAVRLAIHEQRIRPDDVLRTPTGRYLIHKRAARLQRPGGNQAPAEIDSEK